jgi:hypothetical protein
MYVMVSLKFGVKIKIGGDVAAYILIVSLLMCACVALFGSRQSLAHSLVNFDNIKMNGKIKNKNNCTVFELKG